MRLENLKYHIKLENTGNAKELAKKLGISRRTLFNYLETLRIKGMPVKYDTISKTYYFVKDE